MKKYFLKRVPFGSRRRRCANSVRVSRATNYLLMSTINNKSQSASQPVPYLYYESARNASSPHK